MAKEFFSKTNAWCGSIELSLEIILLRAFSFEETSVLTPCGAIGEPRMIDSSIDVIFS